MAKGGLFAAMPMMGHEEDEDDFADDALPAEDDAEEMPELGTGPFDAYAETVFDTEADPAARADALRQAILTILEERG